MNLSKIELKKIQYDFNSWSNRLLQADYQDYPDVLRKYIDFLDSTQTIYEYIIGCGVSTMDIETEVNNVTSSFGRRIFFTGNSANEEVRNVYAILKYIVQHNVSVPCSVALGYSSSKYYQDKTKGFNERFVMVLIRHIENFLTKIGIEMGLDEKTVYNISVKNGQAIFAGDNSVITATNNISVDISKFRELASNVKNESNGLSSEEKEDVNESLEVIEQEIQTEKPKKSLIKTALKTLDSIKSTVEFGAAVAALIEFVTQLI